MSGPAWRCGRHWKPMDDRAAAHHCGVASWDFDGEHRELERRDGWQDWDDGRTSSTTTPIARGI